MEALPATYAPVTAPYACQREALERGWRRPGYAYLMEMGLGKSRVAIDNFCLLWQAGECDAMLLIAPKSVYTNWSRESAENPGELQRWLWPDVARGMVKHVWRSGAKTKEVPALCASIPRGPRFLLVNSEALATTDKALDLCERFLIAHPHAMIVVDESTLMKNPKSARTKAIMSLRRRARWRRVLSGSPMTKSPSDLWPQFEFLEPAALGYRSFHAFQANFCVMRELRLGMRTVRTEVGVRNMDELAERVAQHGYRARKSDCLDLPEKVYLPPIEVELTREQREVYDQLRDKALVELEEGSITTTNVVTQLLRLHQIVCGHVKYDSEEVVRLPENRSGLLMEMLEETEERFVIWCSYKEDVEKLSGLIRARYGPGYVSEWTGRVSQAEREAGEAAFQAGRAHGMLATYAAGARGRTWTRGTLILNYSKTYDLELSQQSEDRTHRIGQQGTCTYGDFCAPRTVEQRIVDALRRKEDVVRAVLRDGPRAVL